MTRISSLGGSSLFCVALFLVAGGSALGQQRLETGPSAAWPTETERRVVGGQDTEAASIGSSHVGGTVPRVSPDVLYQGWRARQLLGKKAAAAEDQRTLGSVRELVINLEGKLKAVIIESGNHPGSPEAVLRVPWEWVSAKPGQASISVQLRDRAGDQTSLFVGENAIQSSAREFRLSELLGDYVRLETGLGYGAVTDVVFNPDDRIHAVLITRDAFGGGGTYAYPIGRLDTKWEPGLSYFGLPYIVPAQANAAGLKVDPDKFREDRG